MYTYWSYEISMQWVLQCSQVISKVCAITKPLLREKEFVFSSILFFQTDTTASRVMTPSTADRVMTPSTDTDKGKETDIPDPDDVMV